MFWTKDELKELQASPVAAKIGRDEADELFRSKVIPVIKNHADIFANAGFAADESIALQAAHRMGSTIMAYAFDLENDEDEDADDEDGWVEDRDDNTLLGMVPMADILNADAEFNVGPPRHDIAA
jgi:N-lysine methyltransferase SETD6